MIWLYGRQRNAIQRTMGLKRLWRLLYGRNEARRGILARDYLIQDARTLPLSGKAPCFLLFTVLDILSAHWHDHLSLVVSGSRGGC